jgi:replicative DNA helicase
MTPLDPLLSVPPHDLSIEQELLGALLCNNASCDVVGALQPAHFYEPLHQTIFVELRRQVARGQRASPLTVRGALPNPCDIAGLTAEQYLARLAALQTPTVCVPQYADLVMHYAMAREYLGAARELASGCARGTPIDEALKIFRNDVEVTGNGYLTFSQRDTVMSHAEVLDAGIARMTAAVNDDPKSGVIPTGLADLDALIGGLRRTNLVIVAGRPGMGKSTFLISTSRQIATTGKFGVGILSMEMDAPTVGLRSLADRVFPRARIAYNAADTGRVTVSQQETLIDGRYESHALPIEYDFARYLTVPEVRASARRLAARLAKKGISLDILFIDYLKFIGGTDRYRGNRTYEVGEITAGLRQLAMELNVCIVLLCQLNRESEKLEDKRPRLDQLRESGDIEQDADLVILMYREGYHLEMELAALAKSELTEEEAARKADLKSKLSRVEFELELNVAKQRMGPRGPVLVFCDMSTSSLRSPRPAGA